MSADLADVPAELREAVAAALAAAGVETATWRSSSSTPSGSAS